MSEPHRPGKCPECKRATSPQYRPFCSKRCADIDLGRWLGGGYVIAGGNSDADEDGETTGHLLPEGDGGKSPAD